jgi:lipoprotein-releasing system ATP-binding protein
MNNDSVLKLENIHKSYQEGNGVLPILKGIDLSISPGEMVGLIGASGSGKSTLLHVAGLLDQPTQGSVILKGQPCENLKDKDRTYMRGHSIGFVYQFHHLLPEFTALENIMLAQMIIGVSQKESEQKAIDLLKGLGLYERRFHYPSQLSGGEKQRVAIARGLINNPSILLADEPTGNLDEHTADKVFEEFIKVVSERHLAVLIVTHDSKIAQRMTRCYRLIEGKLEQVISI